ncbi:hypothetical protein KUCAC02_006006 [Chaenocephalus aceratus]|uniref:Uncharacterized protein n=1 Tax=Chaenocephalus aceratus TaxID=36190 RepID=A0ACB9WRS5_CHAAC|nr:hypothetical protein KUCAC02_006006 [Chaenocephalus aceratus]
MRVCGCSAPNLRRFLLRALLFLAAVLPTSGDCPKSCACNVPTEVHCTFRYLTAIPDHIQPAVERINLGYNSITVLRENDLSGLGNLELLMLHSNTIHSIDDRAFQDLKSLQVLKVSFNKVKEIRKETFKGLDSLLRLHIDHNNIEFISPEAFYGLTRLQFVHLEGNHLQQLHPDTFITLRHNQVFKISSIRNIHLSDNLLTTLPEGIFSGCSQLENLFLHGNPWTCDCRMKWFSVWVQRNTGVLKCKRDRRYPRGQLCPVCESPAPYHNRPLSLLPGDAFTCTKPWIQPHLKKKNISLDEGDYTPVSPKDFIAPLGSIQLKLTDQLHSDASLSCTVQRPSALENLTQTLEEGEGNNATMLTASISTYLVCNIDHEHIQQLWQMLATYSDSPLRLERGLMLTRSPEMVYRYSQMKKTNEGEEGIYTNIEAEIKASPAWLMQGEVSFQLERTTTTFSTLHIKYESVVNLRVENTSPKRDRYSWTMIKRDNKTQTEYTVLTGGVVQLSCQIQGEPKPLLEWILPDGSKVRAPFSSDDRRIIITAEGKLTLRGADASDTGLYRCITTNYLDADVLVFRVAVLSPDVEESDVNGAQLSQPLGTVTGETSERVTVLDSEGSGLEMEDKVYLSLTENTDTLNEIPSSSPSDGTSQESRTITSDRPYPRLRKVDPQKFAEFMKKAQDGLRIKAGAEEEGIQYDHLNTIRSGDGEIGSGLSSVDDTTDFYAKESTSKPGSNRHPVTLQLTVTDTSQETQLQFSGAQPAESETSTGTSLSFTTDPHVTPMMDGPGPLELIVHTSTDPESQTTFTAVSTTERHQDEITFHTTQTIKSPHLPPGSTIISRQQIQIIPNKNSRGGGRRRTFNGRRRVIKPNRITDIQSFINKVKQPSVKKEGNSTVPYRIELTAACDWDEDKKKTETTDLQMVTPTAPSDSSLHMTERPSSAASTTNYYITSNSPFTHTESKSEVSSGYITSADAPEFDPTIDPFFTTNEEESISSTTTTTIASNVIRGRIPWNRLFGGRERENIHGRLKKPLNTKKKTLQLTLQQ